MSEERREGVNLLSPETSPQEREGSFESADRRSEAGSIAQERPVVDQQQIATLKSQMSAAQQQQAAPKDKVLTDLEGILAERLAEIYNQLPENKRAEFKAKGEEVSTKIRTMIVTAKVKAHQILKMIAGWLGIIPNVNVYFLQQEAKIKLDKVLDYAEDYRKTANRL